MKKYCIGVDVGGTNVKYGIFSTNGDLELKWELPTNNEDVFKAVACAVTSKLAENNISSGDIAGIGIGVPGPVNSEGIVLGCPNLNCGVVDIGNVIESYTGFKTAAGNDANLAALGETWIGAARGCSNVVMVTLGTGVGGGIIADGNIVCGDNGAAGEIGHIIVNYNEDAVCGCGGHGHLEQYASATGIVRMGKLLLENTDISSKLRLIKDFTAKDIFDCAKAGDEAGLRLVDELGRYLAAALAHVSAVVNPEVFVIGGGVSKAGTIITDAVEKYYNKDIFGPLKNKRFVLAELGNDAGIYGGARLLLKSLR